MRRGLTEILRRKKNAEKWNSRGGSCRASGGITRSACYLGPSFTTISAFGSNAAMCHYHATAAGEAVGTDGFYLC